MKKRLEVTNNKNSKLNPLSMSRSADRETLTMISNQNALAKAKGNNLLLTLAVAKKGQGTSPLWGLG